MQFIPVLKKTFIIIINVENSFIALYCFFHIPNVHIAFFTVFCLYFQ